MAIKKGTKKNDNIVGTNAADTITGDDGNDTLKGQGGNDVVRGGNGNDKIYGGAGNDRLYGDAGNDLIYTDAGNDLIYGGAGTDTVVFTVASTTVTSTTNGANTVITGASTGTDTLNGVEFVQFSDGKFSLAAKTITLTTAGDTGASFTGGLGADSYSGFVSFENGGLFSTFNVGDQLNGGGNVDTITLTAGGTVAGTVQSTQLTNVENVVITNGASAPISFNAQLWTGLDKIVSQGSAISSSTQVENLTEIVQAEMKLNSGNLTLSYGPGVLAGTTDEQTLILSGNIDGTFVVDGDGSEFAETLNIISQTGANFAGIDDLNPYETLNVSGDQKVVLDVHELQLTTIDASALTAGGLKIISLGTSDLDFTGSGANDTIYFETGTLNTADTIAGGAGTGDTIGFFASQTVGNSELTNVAGVEVLAVGSLGGPAVLTANLDTGAQAAGINTINVLGDAQVSVAVDSLDFTGPLTVNLDAIDSDLKNGGTPVQPDNAGDYVDGSTMTSKLTVTALASHVDGDVIAAGTGSTDELKLTADGAGATDLSNVSGFETLTVLAGSLGTEDASIFLNTDGVVAAGTTLVVNASALTNANAQLFFDGSAETDGKLDVTAGAGADTLVGGGGNDTLRGGSNADSLDGGDGNDSLDGGAGNDVINAGDDSTGVESVSAGDGDDLIGFDASNLTSADTVAGGSGNDILLITDGGPVNDDQFTNVTSVEILSSYSTPVPSTDEALNATLGAKAMAAGVRTLRTGTASNDNISIQSTFTAALTVELNGGDDIVNGASSNADLTIAADAGDIDGSDNLSGGADAGDVLKLAAGGTAALTSVSGFETITVVAGAAPTDDIIINAADATVASGQTLIVNAAALTNAGATLTFDGHLETDGKFNITGGAGNDTLTGGAGNDSINGGAGDDSISGGSGDDSLVGGLGNDVFDTTSGNLDGADTITGGAEASDKLFISGAGIINDIQFLNVTGVEILEGTGSLTANLGTEAYNGGAGIKQVIGTSGVDSLTIGGAYTGAITIDLSTNGLDTVNATGSTATVTIKADASDITAGDALTGGSGSGDTLVLTADNGAGAELDGTTGFENITVVAGSPATNSIFIDVGSNTNTLLAGVLMTVDATALNDVGGAATLSFDGHEETDGRFSITGGTGDDSIAGGGGNDVLNGGSDGDDELFGGAGNDTLTGGSGDDVLAGGQGFDSIDGGAGNDRVYIVGAGPYPGQDNGGADTVNLGSDVDTDTVFFDLHFAVGGESTISNFDAGANEDKFDITTVLGASNGGLGVIRESTGSGTAALVILDSGSYAGVSDAAAAADNLHNGTGEGGLSYIFAWTDTGGVVHISYATVDVLETAQDQFVYLAKLSGATLAGLGNDGPGNNDDFIFDTIL